MAKAARGAGFAPVAAVSILLPVSVACGNFMTGLDQNIVITALPAMGRSLGETPAALSLTITAYLAALIVALPIGGGPRIASGHERRMSARRWSSPSRPCCVASQARFGSSSPRARCRGSAEPSWAPWGRRRC